MENNNIKLSLEEPFKEINSICDKYGMPHVGTIAFNEMCELYFSGNSQNALVSISVKDFMNTVNALDYVIVTGKTHADYWEIRNNAWKEPYIMMLKTHAKQLKLI